MSLRSVRVPAEFEPLFQKAEQVVSDYFRRQQRHPERGAIEVEGERYVLVRGASLSVEFFRVVRDLFGPEREGEAEEFARTLLFDVAHSVGRADARAFHAKMNLEDPLARLSAGPVHFAYTGWAFVDLLPESQPTAGPDFVLIYDHPFSFEADAWLEAHEVSRGPVCTMNAGYSSGWCQESFGVPLASSELLCRARGDERCRFVMAPPTDLLRHVAEYLDAHPEIQARVGQVSIPDVFARKRVEDELRQTSRQLERSVVERTEALRRTEEQLEAEIAERMEVERRLAQSQKMEALGLLAGGVAHDFNNLLTAILGYSDLLQREAAPDSAFADYASEIADAAQRARRLTSQLLVFSRQKTRAARPVDLVAVVRDVLDMLRRLLGEDVELIASLSDTAQVVCVDPGQLEQVVVNLAVNARDAMPRGGTLNLHVAHERLSDERAARDVELPVGDYVVLRVEDDGTGMDDATAARLFEPFFTTKKLGRGAGLGLATVYGIVRESGGGIHVRTAPDAGTTFTLYFPTASPSDVAAVEPEREPDPPESAPTVLLVEDDPYVRRLVERVLELHGFVRLVASDPSRALELFDQHADAVDLVISDVIMPGMSGLELARRLRTSHPDLRVLFMSGYTSDTIERHGGLRPGDRLLRKPFAVETLEAAIRGVLRP